MSQTQAFSALLLSGMTALTLASCNSPQASTSPTQPVAGEKATTVAPNGFTALQSVIANTRAAVEAGNFDQAKTEFANFETSWKTVEDGVKAKSSPAYDAIEKGMDQITKGINSKDKESVLTALRSLSQEVMSVAN